MLPLMKNAFINEYETKKALAEFIVQAPRLSMDQQCFRFESEFSKVQQRDEAVLFNSGGSANLALLQALKNLGYLKENALVGFSALTWSTNTMPIIQMGFIPVPVDCEPTTLNIMSWNLEERLKNCKLDALFITNALGFTGDLDKIKRICGENNILLIEDNCESLGSELPSGKAGNFGIASTFSFFVAHHMSTIEGGMVCTDNKELAQMLRIVRANGWDRNLDLNQQSKIRKKFKIHSEFDAKYTFYDLGYNLRPTEITGFLGSFQLRFLAESINQRERNYHFLERDAINNSDLVPLDHSHLSVLSNFAFPVLCKSPALRDKYLKRFSSADIEIRPVIAGNIQKQPFYSKYVKNLYDLPGTDMIHHCGFYCGNYPELTQPDLDLLSRCLKKQDLLN
ncbi:DegT/DnrJ/EryC1/StrS family aminotransferase [uncultured Methanoregula sp.]|uniref:DegT/DnrJ/EryC1/StrS family aminotransferase n=1 Tax=uncultured Methanoregula sp. TaxID=1005933 RepID=UPI002AAAB8F9|nr:DegT/DnrJ/EryC1/StrS family aminotransferase [uncultured Methanoregula sp.]